MSNLNQIKDIRLSGCGYTLFPAARREEVDPMLIRDLLILINRSVFSMMQDENKAREEAFPLEISVEDISRFGAERRSTLKEDTISAGLVEESEGGNLLLTQKAIKVFEGAADIQARMDQKGEFYCPCCCF